MDGGKRARALRIGLMETNCSNGTSNWYCWWFRNPEKNHRLDVWNPMKNGIFKPYQLVSRISEPSTVSLFYWVTTLLATGRAPARSKLVLYLNPSPVCCCHGRSSFGFASRCNLWEVSIQTFRSFWSQITLSWMRKNGVNRCHVVYCSRMFKDFFFVSFWGAFCCLDEKYANGSKGFEFSFQMLDVSAPVGRTSLVSDVG